MRPGRGFRMVLHTENRMAAMAEAFERLVVQVDVRKIDFAGVKRIRIDGETVVMRSDFNLTGDFVQHRVIGAAMAELKLIGFASERKAEDLMAKTNAEDGHLPHQLTHLRR